MSIIPNRSKITPQSTPWRHFTMTLQTKKSFYKRQNQNVVKWIHKNQSHSWINPIKHKADNLLRLFIAKMLKIGNQTLVANALFVDRLFHLRDTFFADHPTRSMEQRPTWLCSMCDCMKCDTRWLLCLAMSHLQTPVGQTDLKQKTLCLWHCCVAFSVIFLDFTSNAAFDKINKGWQSHDRHRLRTCDTRATSVRALGWLACVIDSEFKPMD